MTYHVRQYLSSRPGNPVSGLHVPQQVSKVLTLMLLCPWRFHLMRDVGLFGLSCIARRSTLVLAFLHVAPRICTFQTLYVTCSQHAELKLWKAAHEGTDSTC